jgi:hypothetical protein
MGCGCRPPQCRTLSSCTVHSSCSSRRLYRTPRPHSIWRTRDSWSAIAPMLPAFRRAARQRSAKAKELASAWKPPGAPQPDIDPIELRQESLAPGDCTRSGRPRPHKGSRPGPPTGVDARCSPTPPTFQASAPPGVVWMSGSASDRVAVVTANARSRPALMGSTMLVVGSNMTCTCPPMRSVQFFDPTGSADRAARAEPKGSYCPQLLFLTSRRLLEVFGLDRLRGSLLESQPRQGHCPGISERKNQLGIAHQKKLTSTACMDSDVHRSGSESVVPGATIGSRPGRCTELNQPILGDRILPGQDRDRQRGELPRNRIVYDDIIAAADSPQRANTPP